MFHVTRQSYGVCKLYCKDTTEFKFQSNLIYLINLLLFLVDFFRFYLPLIRPENLIVLNRSSSAKPIPKIISASPAFPVRELSSIE